MRLRPTHPLVAASVCVAAAIVFAAASATPVAGFAKNPHVKPPNAQTEGMNNAEWSARWWQAIAATPVGDFQSACEIERVGKVALFLASGGAPVTFDCSVESGVSMFLPVFTAALWCPSDCGPGTAAPTGTFDEMDGLIRGLLDAVDPDSQFSVEIDGKDVRDLGDYRAHAPEFSGYVDPDGLLGVLGPQAIGPAAAGGYWLMVKPLPPGEHVIHIYADMLGLLGVDFDTTINLTVEKKEKKPKK